MRAESDAWRMVDGGTPRRTVSGAQICCVRACTARGGGAYHNMHVDAHAHAHVHAQHVTCTTCYMTTACRSTTLRFALHRVCVTASGAAAAGRRGLS
jgi:hypothetical protein